MAFVSYAQNYEDVTLWRALKDVDAGFYIDVGASDPDEQSVTRAFSERGWHGLNLEPVPALHAKFRDRRPRDVNLCLAAGDHPRNADFFEIEATGLSTTDPAIAARHAAEGWPVERRTVQIETLATLCREHAPPTIHFLKIDCEGGEHDALLGADFTRYRPWIVLVEATEPLSQTPNHHLWEPILLDAAYRFAWFDGLNRFYVADEHAARLAPLIALPPNCFDDFIRADPPITPPAPSPHEWSIAPRPAVLSVQDRIALAQRCRDCDPIPKVPGAGTVQMDPDGTPVQVMHNGLKVPADGYCGPWMTRLIALCDGHHEPQEERLFHDTLPTLPEDAAMIELGGNWSYYSAWFLQGAGQRRAVVLEPDPLNRACGEATMRLNGLHATFVAGAAGATSAAPESFPTERSGSLLLPVYSVEQLMHEHGIDHLHLLHCDVQGAETAVLQGCQSLFRSGRIGLVFVSTHVHYISGDPLTHYRCLDMLRAVGAVIEAEHDVYESYSGDGLIVARFGLRPPGWQPVPISRARRNEALFRDPCFDLAEARAEHPAPAAVPIPSNLITHLEQHGEVRFAMASLAAAAATIDGAKVFRTDGPAAGFIIYGPYCACAPGRYECTFLIRADGADDDPGTPALAFDIVLDHVVQPSSVARNSAELGHGDFAPLQFRFTVPHAVATLETRLVLVRPIAATIAAAVAIRRVGPLPAPASIPPASKA